MEILTQLREVVAQGGVAATLANDLLVFQDQLENGELTKEEFDFLVCEIRDIKAQAELGQDEEMCRFLVAAANVLVSVV